MGRIAEKIGRYRASLPEGVTLVAVSKFHPVGALREAYDAGQRHFGESRAQELAAKAPLLPDDIKWHFIGHLQRNKVASVVAHASMIQSVDSLRLLREIDKEGVKQGRRVDVLMEVHVAREETKNGFSPDEIFDILNMELLESLECVHICGIMGMATNTDDESRVRADFERLRDVFERLRGGNLAAARGFDTLSMGMTDDHIMAIACGSTMVRIGTDIFGPREY